MNITYSHGFELIIYLFTIFCKIIKPARIDKTPSIYIFGTKNTDKTPSIYIWNKKYTYIFYIHE